MFSECDHGSCQQKKHSLKTTVADNRLFPSMTRFLIKNSTKMKVQFILLQKRVTNLSKGKFVDLKKIYVRAGDGGRGAVSFVHSRDHKGGPNGGDGGRGGSIKFVADQNTTHLSHLNHAYAAKNGDNGAGRNRHGKNAQNVLLKIPVGTTIRNAVTSDLIADITMDGEELTVAEGGVRGLGNVHFKSPLNVRPRDYTEGEQGDVLWVELELKLIADVALIGFPNAGKSSLLSSISRAQPKIGNYPFTTIKPNVGVMNLTDDISVTVADVPGLLEGAHKNIGLGHAFLRHVERCSSFVYIVDIATSPPHHALEQFEVLKREMELYKPGMTNRPSLFVANKRDLVTNHEQMVARIQAEVAIPVIALSAKHQQNIDELRARLFKLFRNKQRLAS